jgi:signal transduction histidine kinase
VATTRRAKGLSIDTIPPKTARRPRVVPVEPAPVDAARRAEADPKNGVKTAARGQRALRGLEARVAKLEEELSRERKVVALFRDVGLAIDRWRDDPMQASDATGLDSLLVLVLGKMKEAVSADRITLYLLDSAKEYLESRIVEGVQNTTIRLRIPKGIAGRVAKTGIPEIVADAYADERFNPAFDKKTGYRTRSILAVPMHDHDGTILGVVQVLNKASGPFTEADADLLTSLASQAAIVIDNVELVASLAGKNAELEETYDQLLRRMRDLDLLFELERVLGRASTVEDLVLGTVQAARKVIPARVGAVAVKDPELGTATVWVLGDHDKAPRRFPIAPGQGFIGRALGTAAVSVIDNDAAFFAEEERRERAASRVGGRRAGDPGGPLVAPIAESLGGRSDPLNDSELDALAGFVTENAIAVPLEGEGREVLGAFALYNHRDPAGFGPEDIDLAELVAANLATALRLLLAREAREREERLTSVGRLLSGVIHDLKTPLAVIAGYVDLLRDEPDPTVRTRHSDLIRKQLAHLGALQKDVLDFLRGERTLFLRRVYVAPYFAELAKSLDGLFQSAGVTFNLVLDDRGTARFDEQKITRLVQNLARNAVEALVQAQTPAPQVSLRVRRRVLRGKELLEIVTSDNGPGVPKEIEHRLFRSFVTSGKKGGTGLGLAIVKRIAEEHAGTVSVASSPRGATFTVLLPVEGPRDQPRPTTAPPEERAPSDRPVRRSRPPAGMTAAAAPEKAEPGAP